MNYSKQRELILQAVAGTKSHPTAEAVYNELKAEHPRLSLATVYRNLSQLCDAGRIRRLHLPDSPDRFDGDLSSHGHFFCRQCGALVDMDGLSFEWAPLLPGEFPHRVDDCELICYGVCEGCLAERPVN